jgi:hypothetical protein
VGTYNNNSWQQAETALFALRAVNLSLKERLLGRGGAAADAAGSHAFLVELVRQLPSLDVEGQSLS